MRKRFTGLWQHPEFMKLWIGETTSLMGSQVTLLALPLTAVSILKADALQMGVLNATQIAPFLLFGLFAGVWVDRLHRRPILIAGDIGRAILLGSIPVAAIFNVLSLGQLIIVSFLVGILTLFFDVAYQSYLPVLVSREHLVEGNSKLEVSRAIAQIGGPGIAGTLISLILAPLTIALDALSFLVSALFLWRIKTVEPPPEPRTAGRNIWQEIGEGLGIVFGNPLLRSIAGCTATSNFFFSMAFAVFFIFVTRDLHLEAAIIGTILAVGSLGGLAGAVLNNRIEKRFGLGPTIVGSSVVFGVALILIPLGTGPNPLTFLLLVASQFIADFCGVVYNVNQVSLRQTITPDKLQGRMNATMRFLVWGTMPLGSLAGGFLGKQLGEQPTLWIAAIGASMTFLWVALSPVRTLRNHPAAIQDMPAEDVPPVPA